MGIISVFAEIIRQTLLSNKYNSVMCTDASDEQDHSHTTQEHTKMNKYRRVSCSFSWDTLYLIHNHLTGKTGQTQGCFREPDVCSLLPRAYQRTYTQRRPLGGRVLPAVPSVDTMSLHQLVSRRVRPEMVGCLHLGVLQGTWSHCHIEGSLLNWWSIDLNLSCDPLRSQRSRLGTAE